MVVCNYCALLRSCVCTLLDSFALFCVFLKRPAALERPRLGTADKHSELRIFHREPACDSAFLGGHEQ